MWGLLSSRTRRRSGRDLAAQASAARAGTLFFAAIFGAACAEDGRPCYPGDYRSCSCAAGELGYQQCDAEGQGYGACDCSGATPGGAGGTGGTGGAGALLEFMAECSGDAQCESGLCYTYNAKGSHCTIQCTADVDCPSPSPGCNNMGICKAP
ncbi:MAG TPA: hypothetical protein VE093_14145 [Polyangiaceae bacterium]|nr:hypothetical protein [Polyangiaceae bacterium]